METDIKNLDKLADLIDQKREALLATWRNLVTQLPSARHLDTPTLNDHIPVLLAELSTAFRKIADETIPEALLEGSPPMHGLQRQEDGFNIVEVVAEYNILRGCVHDLADSNGLSLQGKPFHILNRVFDAAIGLAVQTFATKQALEVQRRRDEYLAFVAHDLRTPLSAISLAARVMEQLRSEHKDDAGTEARMLKTLHRNVDHLETLVDRVLKESAHVQTETGVKVERRQFDLWPLIEALIHDLHPVAGTSSTRLINSVPEDLIIYADASLLKRIFQNLIANAIMYTPHGDVVIAAKETGQGGAIECRVSDTGSGIAPDRLDAIFEKLETDSQNPDGMGLGLAIVKLFVEAHEGRVTVESSEGSGSTFSFTLPGRDNDEVA